MTALQEFLTVLNLHAENSPTIKMILDTRQGVFLEKERQQIIDAFDSYPLSKMEIKTGKHYYESLKTK